MADVTNSERVRNILLIALLAAIIFFTASQEGVLCKISTLFWLSLITAFAISLWLALGVSTRRLLALILVVFTFEYVKEAIGIKSGLWEYHGIGGQFTFGVWAWVLAGLVCYTLATNVTAKLIKKLKLLRPGPINALIPVALFASIPLTMGEYRSGTNIVTWMFYIAVLLIGLAALIRLEPALLAGITITAWIIGFPSEYVGSASSGIWIFPHNPDYPPFYLIFGCWPLEILAQYAVSAVIANEPLNQDFAKQKEQSDG
ncbi:MAG: hypothetical protein ACYS8Z_01245 [Planctomycetota bacterium]|jgi:hypothetical protein